MKLKKASQKTSGGLNDSYYYYTTVPPYERSCEVYQMEQSDIKLSVEESVGIKIFWWVSREGSIF